MPFLMEPAIPRQAAGMPLLCLVAAASRVRPRAAPSCHLFLPFCFVPAFPLSQPSLLLSAPRTKLRRRGAPTSPATFRSGYWDPSRARSSSWLPPTLILALFARCCPYRRPRRRQPPPPPLLRAGGRDAPDPPRLLVNARVDPLNRPCQRTRRTASLRVAQIHSRPSAPSQPRRPVPPRPPAGRLLV